LSSSQGIPSSLAFSLISSTCRPRKAATSADDLPRRSASSKKNRSCLLHGPVECITRALGFVLHSGSLRWLRALCSAPRRRVRSAYLAYFFSTCRYQGLTQPCELAAFPLDLPSTHRNEEGFAGARQQQARAARARRMADAASTSAEQADFLGVIARPKSKRISPGRFPAAGL
jgi:hypothetical protein